jgi:ABC-type branched-subunit amino acid transport system substrate-binding protein
VNSCGIPDLRATSTTGARASVPNVHGAYSLKANYVETAPADYYKKAFPGVQDKAAFVYLNAGASSINARSEIKGWEHQGYNFVYTAGIPVTEFNYTSYVSAMQSKGVKYVQYVGAYQNAVRLKQAMAQQGYNPVFVMDPTAYDPGFIKSGGSAVEGTHVFIGSETFEDAGKIPEMGLYLQWLQRVAPGANPSFFGIFAWAAGRLFTDAAIRLGGKLTRASLLQALSQIDNYTGNGMFGPQHVGKTITGSCYGFIVLKGGKWVREGPTPYSCGTVNNTGIS